MTQACEICTGENSAIFETSFGNNSLYVPISPSFICFIFIMIYCSMRTICSSRDITVYICSVSSSNSLAHFHHIRSDQSCVLLLRIVQTVELLQHKIFKSHLTPSFALFSYNLFIPEGRLSLPGASTERSEVRVSFSAAPL